MSEQHQADRKAGAETPKVRRAVGLTRLGMWWEELARNFWPLLVVSALGLVVLAFGLAASLGRAALLSLLAVWALALLAALTLGVRKLRQPSHEAARRRVDAQLPGRPLAALRDQVVLGGEDAGSRALWAAHLQHMEMAALGARAVLPDADLPRRDPFALRLAGMTGLAMVAIFAPVGQVGQGIAAIAASMRPTEMPQPVEGRGPGWEGWAEPPAYTRRPTVYLNALPEGEVLVLPKGSKLSFRLYGEGAAVAQTVGAALPDRDPMAPEFTADASGIVEVAGRSFAITVSPDAPPTVSAGPAPERRSDGRLVQEFQAADDNGIAAGQAVISLDLAAMDRRFGLSLPPEAREEVRLDLPLPSMGQRKEVKGRLVSDLSRHPWANLPVVLTLQVSDGIDQTGAAQPLHMVLPGRRFFDPTAAALIELRRDLLWTRENAADAAMLMRTVSWQPEGFLKLETLTALQGAIGVLEAGDLTPKLRDDMAQMLWDVAVGLEDGGLANALEQMQQAQERLSEAIRNGASPDEIQRLMDELRAATDAYTDLLAQQGQDPAERFDRSPQQQGQQITGDQIQQMMDEIQRLMNEGRMAEAQALLEQFNRMMENLRVTESEGDGSGQRGRPSQRLADSLREQQRLSDDVMRQMQDQFGQWQPQDPQGSPELADRQRALREELGRQRGLMPGRGTPEGEAARRELDNAGRAMEEAEQALRDGNSAGAMERQAQAIERMREGMRALGNMNGQNPQQDQNQQDGQQGEQQGGAQPGENGSRPGENGQRGLAQPFDRQPDTDPLGRSTSGQGGRITSNDQLPEGADPSQRARDLQDEIRRRSGEQARPRDERDYLGRLLDRF